MQQDGVALAVQAHRHSTDWTVDHIAFEGDTLALEIGHETYFSIEQLVRAARRQLHHDVELMST